MYRKCIVLFLLICATYHVDAQETGYGEVQTRYRGSDAAMSYFDKGLLLLYAMDYKEAAENFSMAQLLDPNFAMAAWGEAMSYYRPFTGETQMTGGQAALYKLAVTEDKRLAKAESSLEKDMLKIAEIIFSKDKGTEYQKDTALSNAYEKLYLHHQNETEALAWYALHHLEKFLVKNEQASAGVALKTAQKVLDQSPKHPGAMFCKILASPAIDAKGVLTETAKQFQQAASASVMARHVASRPMAATGMWKDFTEANAAAFALSEKQRSSRKGAIDDLFFHALWAELYGLLMQGKYEEALTRLRQMNTFAQYSRSALSRHYLLLCKSTYLMVTEQWDSPAGGMEVPLQELPVYIKCLAHYLDGRHHLAKSDINKAKWHLMQLVEQKNMAIQRKKAPFNPLYFTAASLTGNPTEEDILRAEILALWLGAQIEIAEGNKNEALASLRKASEIHEKVYEQMAPQLLPGLESVNLSKLLADTGETEEALARIQHTLKKYPANTKVLHTMVLLAHQSGKQGILEAAKKQLKDNWRQADVSLLHALP
ncbi:MAG: hypothetical protein JJU28_19765 [Cyclobacteriaceae bacterium]|nr:hypothetical protein [Cyclobacteriaceae bacterium]